MTLKLCYSCFDRNYHFHQFSYLRIIPAINFTSLIWGNIFIYIFRLLFDESLISLQSFEIYFIPSNRNKPFTSWQYINDFSLVQTLWNSFSRSRYQEKVLSLCNKCLFFKCDANNCAAYLDRFKSLVKSFKSAWLSVLVDFKLILVHMIQWVYKFIYKWNKFIYKWCNIVLSLR